jgi:transposase-like protein
MGKKGMERRNYSKEFKGEAAALAEKREKPISQIAEDLGVNEHFSRKTASSNRRCSKAVNPYPPLFIKGMKS